MGLLAVGWSAVVHAVLLDRSAAVVHTLLLAGLVHDNVMAGEQSLSFLFLLNQVAACAAPGLSSVSICIQASRLSVTDPKEIPKSTA